MINYIQQGDKPLRGKRYLKFRTFIFFISPCCLSKLKREQTQTQEVEK